jgi:hypothetical protein
MAAKRWNELDPRLRRLIVVGGATEGVLKLLALIDIKRRPSSQVRGKKKVWASAMLLNSAGLIPLSYFIWGRRRDERADTGPGLAHHQPAGNPDDADLVPHAQPSAEIWVL